MALFMLWLGIANRGEKSLEVDKMGRNVLFIFFVVVSLIYVFSLPVMAKEKVVVEEIKIPLRITAEEGLLNLCIDVRPSAIKLHDSEFNSYDADGYERIIMQLNGGADPAPGALLCKVSKLELFYQEPQRETRGGVPSLGIEGRVYQSAAKAVAKFHADYLLPNGVSASTGDVSIELTRSRDGDVSVTLRRGGKLIDLLPFMRNVLFEDSKREEIGRPEMYSWAIDAVHTGLVMRARELLNQYPVGSGRATDLAFAARDYESLWEYDGDTKIKQVTLINLNNLRKDDQIAWRMDSGNTVIATVKAVLEGGLVKANLGSQWSTVSIGKPVPYEPVRVIRMGK